MSDRLDLYTLERFRPTDLPHRYSSPAETQRLVDACQTDAREQDAKGAAFELAHPARTAEPPLWLRAAGLVTVLALAVVAGLAVDLLPLWVVKLALFGLAVGLWFGRRR